MTERCYNSTYQFVLFYKWRIYTMSIYDLGTASLAANGEVTGVGTTWKAPLTLIRVGSTIVFKTEPVQIYTISEIISDTQINVYNPKSETVPAGTGYAILAHDGITVQGLAQDVAETLRYYQGQETEIAGAVESFKSFDLEAFKGTAMKVEQDAASAELSKNAAKASEDNAIIYEGLAWRWQDEAKTSEENAKTSETNARQSENNAQSWAESINPNNLLTKEGNLSGLASASESRQNIEVDRFVQNTDSTNIKSSDASSVSIGGAASISIANPLGTGCSLMLEASESNSLSISNRTPMQFSWTGRTEYTWYNSFARAGLARAGNATITDYRIQVFSSGNSEALFRFLPDQRLISGSSEGEISVNEFQKAPLSDRDIKKDIKYTSGIESYNRVKQWLPSLFKYKDSDVQRYGLIAQDLLTIDHEYVHLLPGSPVFDEVEVVNSEGVKSVERVEIGHTDDVLSLDSNVLLMDLCSAMVYLINKVEKLETKIESIS